jgi:phosphatidylserine decarboxylase
VGASGQIAGTTLIQAKYCTIDQVIHVPGDVWNVNPAALNRIDRVFCRNERAIISARLRDGEPLTLVAVGAILVSGIHLHCVKTPFAASRWLERIACRASYRKGEELGYFSHGSTIIVLGSRGLTICDQFREGRIVRMGEAMLQRLSIPAPQQ